MGIDVMNEIQSHGAVENMECIRCTTCVHVCPRDALRFTRKECGFKPVQNVPVYSREAMSGRMQAFLLIPLVIVAYYGYDPYSIVAPLVLSFAFGLYLLYEKYLAGLIPVRPLHGLRMGKRLSKIIRRIRFGLTSG